MRSMSFAATTDEKTSTEPTDRSIPEVMMTKVIPTPSTAQTAMFWEISEKLLAREELASGGHAEEGDDDEQHTEDPHRLQAADPLEQAVLWAVVHDRRLVLLGDDAHSASSVVRLASRAPVIAPTSCSTVDPLGGQGRHPRAEPHDLDAVRHFEDGRHGVGDQDDGDALVPDPPDGVQHVLRLDDAEGGGRLVQEDDLVGPRDGADDGDLLALAAGHRADLRRHRSHGAAEFGEAGPRPWRAWPCRP